jgi:light-regulated signal transduction histidine kinase (bacteriophytochrome)
MRILLVEDEPSAARFIAKGCGLAIARWVAEVHGGRVDVRSSGPEGTTFAASLPA